VASVSKDIVRHFDRLDVLDPRRVARELEKKREHKLMTDAARGSARSDEGSREPR
jgi:hypothetical protein